MKNKIASLLASALAVLCVAVTANASFYSFDADKTDWVGGLGVTRSNGAPTHGTYSLVVPIDNIVSNDVDGGLGNTVWTDFYTIPSRYSSVVNPTPVVDPAATGQFFVNSNGFWVTMSGPGGSVINVCTQSLVTGLTYPTVTQYTAFYHVSVFHNYTSRKWSLFVNNVPLAENLNFINQAANGHDWFQVQNYGGHPTNVCWLDDYLLTNAMVTTGGSGTNTLTAIVPGTTLPIADALVYFGTTEDPRPAATNFGVAGGDAVSLQFDSVPGQRYVLIGGGSPVLAMSNISTTLVDTAGTSNAIVDATALQRGSRYYYKLITVSQVDGSVVLTNEETYAWYKQDRTAGNRWYYSGVPVIYVSTNASANTLAGIAGDQLAGGLAVNDLMYVAASSYEINEFGKLGEIGIGTPVGEVQLAPGSGVMIKRAAGAASQTYAVIAGRWTNNIGTITLHAGWNSLTWPYDTSATLVNSGFPSTPGDSFLVLRGSGGDFVNVKRLSTRWSQTPESGNWPQPGEGFLYYSINNNASWTPVR